MTREPVVMEPLVADILTAMITDTQSVTTRLIDSPQHDAAHQRATLDAIRDRVEDLCTGPYQPSTVAIMSALWPSQAEIEHRMEVSS